MRAYFSYLRSILLTKTSLWIVTSINWLFTLIVLIIVPVCVELAPMNIWNFEQISLQGMYIIINSAICAFLVIYIFRSGIEDQTELIIMSKPIKRSKIILAKFIWVLIFGLFIVLGESFISLFTLCFGQYDPIDNIKGMHYEKLLPLIGSLFLGTMVVCLVFDSLGILISIFGNKVQIIITLVAVAIVFSIYDVVNRMIIYPIASNIKDEIGSSPKSFQIKTANGQYDNFVYTQTVSESDAYELYKRHNSPVNALSSYLNFNGQLSKIYSSFGVNDIQYSLCNKSFGDDSSLNVTIKNQNDNLLAYYISKTNNNSDDVMLSMPYYSSIVNDKKGTTPSYSDYGFTNITMNCGSLAYMKFLGATADTIWVSNSVKYLYEPSKFYSIKKLTNLPKGDINEFNKLVFDEIGINLLDPNSNSILPWIVNDSNSVEQQKTFTQMCFTFMSKYKDKFNFSLNDVAKLNLYFSQIQFSLIKDYLNIYWKQIFPKLLDELDVTAEKFFKNESNVFVKSFNSLVKFNSPFDEQKVISTIDNNYHLYDFLHSYYAYSSCAIFNNLNFASDYVKPISIFGNACHGMNLEGYPNTDEIFYSFSCNKLILSSNLNMDKMYHYVTSEYVDNKTAIIVWTIISMLITSWAVFKYIKCDIS